MVPDGLWYHTGCVVRSCQTELSFKWGAAGRLRGILKYMFMFMFDWSALMTPRRPTWAGLLLRTLISYCKPAQQSCRSGPPIYSDLNLVHPMYSLAGRYGNPLSGLS
jgi:hypothetical protein